MKQITTFATLTLMLLLSGCKIQDDPARREELDILHHNAVVALKSGEFVLEANYLVFRNGRTVNVMSNTNFVALSGGNATVQIAFNNSPFAGPNGLGGITVKGRASNIKIDKDRHGNITHSMNVNGVGISAMVIIRLTEGGNMCSATVIPNFNSNRISFTGSLYPREFSTVFSGMSL